MKRIYLDHAATTPILPEAQAAMAGAVEHWANPSSPHSEGRAARAALEKARGTIAETLKWKHDVLFTSGASEAIGIAASRALPHRRVVGCTEHEVVLQAMGAGAAVMPVDPHGIIDFDALERELREGPALVAIQHVNNETGVIQPISDLRRMVEAAGSLLLVDCAQSAGKLDLPDADFVAVSAHKFGGPPGIGALLVRDLATLVPSGGQEKGYRRGTQNVPAVVAFAAALKANRFRDAMPRIESLRRKLETSVAEAGGVVIGEDAPRSPAIGSIAMPGATSSSLLVQLDLAGFAVSAGSACSSGSMKPSRVLAAMGVAADVAEGAIRVSFGPNTTEEEVRAFLAEWMRIAGRQRASAA